MTAAAAAGIAGGWAFALIWARVAPMSVQGQFWSTMTSVATGMLNAEHSREFIDLYRRLGVALYRYLGRNLGGLLLASLPLIALAGVFRDSQLMLFGMATLGAVAAMIWRWRT
jgi:hypothetical protein